MYMKFDTNVAFTVRNTKKIEKERERKREREMHNFGHNHGDSEKHGYHSCMRID